ncbi:UPF0587 protein v1g245604-like isoform X10 [Rhopilema esculentum]|uniref:UPF0587 protein v1g245604-like isoform X9 n=1 Tax=Rhopilema esculentum TaxID=499914 RepID=UPI0031DEB488
MVHIALEIKADMESVTSLTPEGEDFRWYLKLKCLNCGEESKAFVYLTLIDSVPLKGGRGHASVVSKCKLCSRENSIDIVKDSYKPYNAVKIFSAFHLVFVHPLPALVAEKPEGLQGRESNVPRNRTKKM